MGIVAGELKKCILLCSNCHMEIHEGLIDLPENYYKFNENYGEYINYSKIEKDECPRCGNEKPIKHKNCSRNCALKSRELVDWDNINLKELLKNHNYSQIGKKLGVSGTTVKNRAVRYGLI